MTNTQTFVPWEEIPHTADWSLRVRGRSLEELFINAALGMASLVADLTQVEPAGERHIEVEAATLSGLLVAWLNELIFYTDVEGIVFYNFTLSELREPGDPAAGEWARLEANATAGKPPSLLKAIKAVTHHYATITREGELYQVDLVFDV